MYLYENIELMKKDNKQRLFEMMSRVNKITLNENFENQITKDDIKDVSVSSVTPEYGGGYGLYVVMNDGNKHQIKLSNEELATLKNSPVQHPDIEKTMSFWDMAVNKINSGNYERIEKIQEEI